jgi:pyrimidine operon attenuation protein/uracil phosphoribosyltransferase
MNENSILDAREINHKIERIAYQIYETFAAEKEIILAGISGNGFVFAKKIEHKLKTISTIKVLLCEVQIDKQNPFNEITTSLAKVQYEIKNIEGHIYEKSDESKIISIPVHRNQDLKLGTLKSIMKVAQLVEDDL